LVIGTRSVAFLHSTHTTDGLLVVSALGAGIRRFLGSQFSLDGFHTVLFSLDGGVQVHLGGVAVGQTASDHTGKPCVVQLGDKLTNGQRVLFLGLLLRYGGPFLQFGDLLRQGLHGGGGRLERLEQFLHARPVRL